MTATAIETRQLTKRYGETTAVDALDLSVATGRITCLLGPNGSGKTTTVAMLTTLRRPTSGTASVCGYDIVDEAALVRAVIGVTLQHTGVDDLMTGREMLALQAVLQGLPSGRARRRINELVDLLDLSTHIDSRLGTWSGGLRRRMDLAAALVHRPRLLFLDEPTTGLDPSSRRALWAEIRRLNTEEGVTVFLTTQYLEEADVLADEVSILRDGRPLVTASPAELKAGLGEQTLVARFGTATEAEAARTISGGHIDPDQPLAVRLVVDQRGVPELVADLGAAGVGLTGITIAEPSLEDVFISLTEAEVHS